MSTIRVNGRFGKISETPPCQVVVSGKQIAAILPPQPDLMATPQGVVSIIPVNNRNRSWNTPEEGEVLGPIKSERHFDNHPLVGRCLPEKGGVPNRKASVAAILAAEGAPQMTGTELFKKAMKRS